MTCIRCTQWKPCSLDEFGGWGECSVRHTGMFVKFPEGANVPRGVARLLTAPDFGCIEFQAKATND